MSISNIDAINEERLFIWIFDFQTELFGFGKCVGAVYTFVLGDDVLHTMLQPTTIVVRWFSLLLLSLLLSKPLLVLLHGITHGETRVRINKLTGFQFRLNQLTDALLFRFINAIPVLRAFLVATTVVECWRRVEQLAVEVIKKIGFHKSKAACSRSVIRRNW